MNYLWYSDDFIHLRSRFIASFSPPFLIRSTFTVFLLKRNSKISSGSTGFNIFSAILNHATLLPQAHHSSVCVVKDGIFGHNFCLQTLTSNTSANRWTKQFFISTANTCRSFLGDLKRTYELTFARRFSIILTTTGRVYLLLLLKWQPDF